MIISNLRIGTRLGLGFTLVTLLALLNGVVAYHNLGGAGAQWNEFDANVMRKNTLAMQGKLRLGAAVQDFKDFVIRGRDYADKFNKELDAIDGAGDEYAAHEASAREQALLAELKSGVAAYRVAMGKLVGMKSQGASIEALDKAVAGADKPIHKALDGLIEITRADTEAAGAGIAATVLRSERIIVVLTLVGAMLAVLFSVLVTRSIVKPMRKAVKIAQAVAAGDLSTSIEARYTDETGMLLKALKDMNLSLQGIVGEVRGATDTIATASQQVAMGNADLSTRTEAQASALEETASSMEQLTSTIQENFNHAQLASSLAQATADNAGRSGTAVGEVVTTMGAIHGSSRKIVDIISVIDGIAFQTNILALNAAVEAARAGEQGRGFAVVAGEVRSLAQRAAAAAKEIKVLIDESVGNVERGTQLADAAGASMQEVVAGITRVASIVGDMAAAAREQSASIDEVSQAVLQMDEMTQQNAALVEESATAAHSMQARAAELARVVSVFKLEARAAHGGHQVVALRAGRRAAPGPTRADTAARRIRA